MPVFKCARCGYAISTMVCSYCGLVYAKQLEIDFKQWEFYNDCMPCKFSNTKESTGKRVCRIHNKNCEDVNTLCRMQNNGTR